MEESKQSKSAEMAKKLKEKTKYRLIIVSALSVLLCIVFLCGTSWAWFASSVGSGSNTLVAATYTLSVSAWEDGASPTEVTPTTGGQYLLDDGTYTFTLTASGNATTGFCRVTGTVDSTAVDLFTAQIAPGTSLSFTLTVSDGATLTCTGLWGTSAKFNAPDIADGSTLSY